MVKIADTYNPITGEYVKKISDWVSLTGDLAWTQIFSNSKFRKFEVPLSSSSVLNQANVYRYDSKKLDMYSSSEKEGMTWNDGTRMQVYLSNEDSGISSSITPTTSEIKAYFFGHKMCNADGTAPYYKSEVPYTPATWAEWAKTSGISCDSTGATFTSLNGNFQTLTLSGSTTIKSSTKYGVLFNLISSNIAGNLYFGGGTNNWFNGMVLHTGSGTNINKKVVLTSEASLKTNTLLATGSTETTGSAIKFKDFRIFELPTGSQIEADFTNLTADELSAKYTFNGLCVKNWKKVTDGTGLTSTLPTASYDGYTPYKMIYQLATPEISYLTPKATISLYDTNTIVETDTSSDCKADVTVGYKLKDGVTAVTGDITAPTPDYMSAVNSVSEDGLNKGIVRSPNIVTNGNFANGTTGWGGSNATISATGNVLTNTTTGVGFYGRSNQVVVYPYATNKKVYARVKFRVTNSDCTRVQFGIGTSPSYFYTFGNLVLYPIANQWYEKSVILTENAEDSDMAIMIDHYYNDSASGRVMELQNVIAVDLTASFGAGNEPTKEQCDILFATWQDKASTQATLPTLRKIGTVADTYNPETGVLVQRIGKKVFDGTELSTLSIGDGNSVVITKPIENLYYGNTYYSPFVGSHHMKMTGVPNADWSKSMNYGKGCISITSALWLSVDNKKINTISEAQEWFVQQYANGTPVTVYYQLAIPVVTTLTPTAMPTYSPTTVVLNDSTVKGNVSADYKLKVGATPVAGDFIASPESVNDIKDLGNSIDVVSSVGRRNLIVASGWRLAHNNGVGIDTSTFVDGVGKLTIGANRGLSTYCTGFDRSNLKDGETYTFSIDVMTDTTRSLYMDWRRGFSAQTINAGEWVTLYYSRVYSISDAVYLWGVSSGKVFGYETNVYYKNPKAELSNTYSSFTPAPENIPYNTTTNGVYKTNILLGAPLRSIGDVKDRLFKDSDGKWKVERNVGEEVINQYTGLNQYQSKNNYGQSFRSFSKSLALSQLVCDKLRILLPDEWSNGSNEGIFVAASGNIALSLNESRLSSKDINGVNEWLSNNNLTVQYQLATPTYETLSQELQTKLDNIPTFSEHNYVYTITNDNLQPTLHVDYKKLSWLRSRLLVNSLKIYSRNLTDAEMIQNYKVEKERFGM